MAYLLLVTVLLFVLPHRSSDDPFITYRYARNLANGLGFVYNPGQHILSTTTPLFTLLLAGIFPLWEKLPAAANLVGAFSLATGGLAIWLMAQRWKTPAVGWVGLLIYPTFPLLITTIGGEMPLLLALTLGAIAAYAYRRFALCGLLVGLAVLTRPDALLAASVLVIDYLVYRRSAGPSAKPENRQVGLAIFTFALVVIPWIGFAWVYFGSPIPATLLAKQRQGLMLVSQKFAPGLLTVVHDYQTRLFLWLEALLAVSGLPALLTPSPVNAAPANSAAPRRWILVVAWSGLHFAAYTLLGVSRYPWYYAPLVPGFLVLTGLGIQNLSRLAGRRLAAPGPAILSGALVVILLLSQAAYARENMSSVDPRYGQYRAAGQWLARNTPQQTLVGTLEIGVIGYYGARPLVDFAGLLQPEVARQLGPQTSYSDAAIWTVEHYRPQYLLLHRGLYPQLESATLPQRCQWLDAIPGEPYGTPNILDIYTCPEK